MTMYSNRSLVIVTGKEAFRDWLVNVNGVAPELKFLNASKGCYLIDSTRSNEERNKVLEKAIPEIMASELSDYVEDKFSWPELTYEKFSEFFDFDICPIIGDLGTNRFESSKL